MSDTTRISHTDAIYKCIFKFIIHHRVSTALIDKSMCLFKLTTLHVYDRLPIILQRARQGEMRQGPLILHEQKEQMNAHTLPNGFPLYLGPREISLTKLVCKRATLLRPIIFFANDFRFEDETNTTMPW